MNRPTFLNYACASTGALACGSAGLGYAKLHPETMASKADIVMDLDGILPDKTLDTTGLSGPMPLLKTKKALSKMAAGQVIEVISSDPGSQIDLPKLGSKNGNTYLGALTAENGVYG